VYGPVPQGAFLNKLGARERATVLCEKASKKQKASILSGLARLTAPDQMGELFKALCLVHPDLPKPEGF
jgi:NADH dehydrogenase [ubiquinone] 1 alpha subcomplex assembly factor 7